MSLTDLALSRRLERAEGHACTQFAEARRWMHPASGAEWRELAGAYAVFDGAGSPVTQTFGLGLFQDLKPEDLDEIERFFFERGAAAEHEVSPYAGVAALDQLCARQYRPIEISSVLYRPVVRPEVAHQKAITVRVAGPEDAALWGETSAKGWSEEHPELLDFLLEFGAISVARRNSVCFLAEYEGILGAAGVLCLHEGVALFAGASTVPGLRRHGLQGALLETRMRYAADMGCDLAMMVAGVGSGSQRNAERQSFQIAYTRTKWRLAASAGA